MMNILLITDNFYPETNAPANRGLEHCLYWAGNGNNVTVITSAPNFPEGIIYKGYKNSLYQFSYHKGIRIIRVWTFLAENKGIWKRLIDHISFMFTSFFCGLFIKKIDVVIGTSPHIFSCVSALLISKIKRKKFVFELRDLWPDSLIAVGLDRNKILFRFGKYLEFWLYKNSDLIICLTNSFRNYLMKLNLDSKKVKVVTNGVNTIFFDPKDSIKKKKELLHFNVSYFGTIGMAHSIITLVNTAKIIQDNYPKLPIKFTLIGSGAEHNYIKKYISDNKIKNIKILKNISRIKILSYLKITHISIIHLKKSTLFKTVIPSKLFENMAMGIPIVHGVLGESKNLVLKYKIGITFTPENSKDLCKSILKLYHDKKLYNEISKNCLNTSKLFERNNLAKKMLDEINKVACIDK